MNSTKKRNNFVYKALPTEKDNTRTSNIITRSKMLTNVSSNECTFKYNRTRMDKKQGGISL